MCTGCRTRRSPKNWASASPRPRCASTGRGTSCATCCTTKEPRPMRCDEATALLPARVGGDPVGLDADRHVETCLRCQAELARYRPLLRTLSMLRTRYVE